MVKCLAQKHKRSGMTSHAGILTHILTTPELESDAVDRSATTLHDTWCKVKIKSNYISQFFFVHPNLSKICTQSVSLVVYYIFI